MRIESYIDLISNLWISGLFSVAGSFGRMVTNPDSKTEKDNKTIYEYTNGKVKLTAEFTKYENGAVIRRDTLENLTDEPMTINQLFSRFRVAGSNYEVYTQFNAWLHESDGAWQKLVTQVATGSDGIRTCDAATPVMALHNTDTGANYVFHAIPNGQWKMIARKHCVQDKELVTVDIGFDDSCLALVAEPHETIKFPEIIFFSAKSKVDLDAYKLHEVINQLFPRKTLPVYYNSWLHCFDKLDIDDLFNQIDTAADMGFEAFMIDAGWFGDGASWAGCVGDWSENMTSGPAGRLIDISNRVRERGMVFGLWFEPERAGWLCKAVKEYPEQYLYGWALNFADENARNRMFDVISEQIEKYHIGWVKFDFNQSMPYDPSGNAFYRYMQGQREFIERLRKRFPDLYISNCASGGQRMDLSICDISDSYWLSDNHSPVDGIRIIKDTLKRMPSSMIDRWNVQMYCDGFPCYDGGKRGKMININDGVWGTVIGINDSFYEEFVKGGPLGMSCDLAAFPENHKERWKSVISQYKLERDFYKNASARILVDSDTTTVLEYSDTAFDKCFIQVFTKTSYATDIIIYPIVDESASYTVGDEVISGKEIAEDGIYVKDLATYSCKAITLIKEK